jgi:hypothetical protein
MSTKAQQLLPHLIAYLNLWNEKSFTVAELYDQLLRTIDAPDFDVLEGVSPAILRDCAKLLPEGCVKRLPNRRLVFQTRAFAKPEELHEALRQIERERFPESYDLNLGMLLDKIMPDLQQKLVIGKPWMVWQSLQWAQAYRQFTLDSTWYGQLIRWTNAGMKAAA